MAAAPLIIVTADAGEKQRRGVTDLFVQVSRDLVAALEEAGGVPVVVSWLAARAREALLSRADGIVLSGSAFDVPPELYGEAVLPRCGPLLPERSRFELELARAAIARRIPLLAICGGHQLVNVALGGTLYQDLSYAGRPLAAHVQQHDHHSPAHAVTVASGTLAHRLLGASACTVNSTHHQVLRDVAPDLTATVTAEDGVVEAFEHRGGAPLLGVQWHPEYLAATHPEQAALFAWLVAQARDRRAGGA